MFTRGLLTGIALSSSCFTAIYYSFRPTKNNVHALSPFEDIARLDKGDKIFKYGIPDRGTDIRYYTNHVLSYDQGLKTPVWVAEHLSADTLKGSAKRKNMNFRPDPGIKEDFSAQNSDYLHSGWSRGHMAPAGDCKSTQEAMFESFYLTNILPQNYENNAGFWNRLEIYCRDLTRKYKDVRVISGPVMIPTVESDGKKYVKYQVIGKNEIAVPTHLFKIILAENDGKTVAMGTFIVPNAPVSFHQSLREFQVDIKYLEKRTGIEFLPEMKGVKTVDLCTVDGCQLMKKNEFELYFIGRKVDSANTLHRLETVWKELEEKNLKPDKYLLDLYNKKRKELDTDEAKRTEL